MYVRTLAWFWERRETLLSCPVCFTLVITVIVCVILKKTSSLGRQLIPNICTLCTEDTGLWQSVFVHTTKLKDLPEHIPWTLNLAQTVMVMLVFSSHCQINKQGCLLKIIIAYCKKFNKNCGRFNYLHLRYNKFVFKNQKRRHNTSGDIQCFKQIPWFSLNSTHVPQYYQSK